MGSPLENCDTFTRRNSSLQFPFDKERDFLNEEFYFLTSNIGNQRTGIGSDNNEIISI